MATNPKPARRKFRRVENLLRKKGVHWSDCQHFWSDAFIVDVLRIPATIDGQEVAGHITLPEGAMPLISKRMKKEKKDD